jgi:D-arginine dehydrogenase
MVDFPNELSDLAPPAAFRVTGTTLKSQVLIIGGGVAGAGAAYELSAFASVILLEREPHCGYHSTGRSAASFTENYGGALIRRLAIASRSFLENPPADFCAHALLSPLGLLTIAREDQLGLLEEQLRRAQSFVPSITRLSVDAAVEKVPVLRRDYLAGAFFEPHSREIDVNELHQAFLRAAKARGARVVTGAEVCSLEHRRGLWHVAIDAGASSSAREPRDLEFSAPVLINAAGAWADVIAERAGVPRLGLVPKCRTAFTIPLPAGIDARHWPMVSDVGERLYFKRDAGQLLVSPADATPTAPCDAYADDLEVAAGVERLERVIHLEVQRVTRTWAGLRTFAPDGSPVVGQDSRAEGFYWLAAQGGYGIKTSPALSRACAGLIRTGKLPEDLLQAGITAEELSPDRFRSTP